MDANSIGISEEVASDRNFASQQEDQINLSENEIGGSALAQFINCHSHKKGLNRIKKLKPGLLRLFIRDWKREAQVSNLHQAIKVTDNPNIHYLIQFHASDYHKDPTFLPFVKELAVKYKGKIKYWQLSNEMDHASFFPKTEDQIEEFSRFFNKFSKFVKDIDSSVKLSISLSTKVFDIEKRNKMFIKILNSLKAHCMQSLDVIDIHWHRNYLQAEKLYSHIEKIKAYFKDFNVEYIMTENNTFTLDAIVRKPDFRVVKKSHRQTEGMQASYALRTIISALAAGVKYVTFGYSVERLQFGKKTWTKDHYFALNGLWYSEDKEYLDKIPRSGPKRSAFTYFLLSNLIKVNSKVEQIQTDIKDLLIYRFNNEKLSFNVLWVAPRENVIEEVQKITLDKNTLPTNFKIISAIVSKKGDFPPASIGKYDSVAYTEDEKQVFIDLLPGHPVLVLPSDYEF